MSTLLDKKKKITYETQFHCRTLWKMCFHRQYHNICTLYRERYEGKRVNKDMHRTHRK
jgi:hypothetical protein